MPSVAEYRAAANWLRLEAAKPYRAGLIGEGMRREADHYDDQADRMLAVTNIRSVADLQDVAKRLGVRDDWHEPDNQDVSAVIVGGHLDNAMCSRESPEYGVVIKQGDREVAYVNLALLLAFATGTCTEV